MPQKPESLLLTGRRDYRLLGKLRLLEFGYRIQV